MTPATRPFAWFVAAALLLMPAMAGAQNEKWSDAEVVITAHPAAAPAMWKVQKGDSQVIILGILPVFPKKQAWNTRRVENALKGAHALITPPASNISLGDMWHMMMNKGLPGHAALKDSLPPELNARYEAAAARAGVSIRDFAHDKPVWAGARLRRTILAKQGLSDEEPLQTVVRLAHRANVPVRAAGSIKVAAMFNDVNAMSPAASQACLGDALDDIDFDLDREPAAATAWTIGDIRTVRTNYKGSAMMKCLAGSDQAAVFTERNISDTTAAVVNALNTPGKTVAVFPLATLLTQNGALDRLRAHGYTISSPQD